MHPFTFHITLYSPPVPKQTIIVAEPQARRFFGGGYHILLIIVKEGLEL